MTKFSFNANCDALGINVTHCKHIKFILYWQKGDVSGKPFLDAIASPSSHPCQWVSEWVSQ